MRNVIPPSLFRYTALFIGLTLGSTLLAAGWSKPASLKTYALQVEVAQNEDGSLIAFYVQPDREIGFTKQTEPGSDVWTKPATLDLYGNQIAVGRNADGRLEMFIIGTMASVITHVTQSAPNSDQWGKELDLDVYGNQIEVVQGPSGELALFYLKPDREIAYRRQSEANSATWGKAQALDVYGNQFAVTTQQDGRIEIGVIGTMANVMSHLTETAPGSNTWGKETELKGLYASQIEWAANSNGALSLFMLNMSREIAYLTQTEANASTWAPLVKTDVYGNAFTLGQYGDGRLEVALIGTMANVMSHLTQQTANSNDWTSEKDIKGYGKQLDIATNTDGSLELVYVAALANEVHHARAK